MSQLYENRALALIYVWLPSHLSSEKQIQAQGSNVSPVQSDTNYRVRFIQCYMGKRSELIASSWETEVKKSVELEGKHFLNKYLCIWDGSKTLVLWAGGVFLRVGQAPEFKTSAT